MSSLVQKKSDKETVVDITFIDKHGYHHARFGGFCKLG